MWFQLKRGEVTFSDANSSEPGSPLGTETLRQPRRQLNLTTDQNIRFTLD